MVNTTTLMSLEKNIVDISGHTSDDIQDTHIDLDIQMIFGHMLEVNSYMFL